MLWPSTRATWKPNVTMSVAYTAAETTVFIQATSSSPTRAKVAGPRAAAGLVNGLRRTSDRQRRGAGRARFGMAAGLTRRAADGPE